MTKLPRVTVAPDGPGGWRVTCDQCPLDFTDPLRPNADSVAVFHRSQPHPPKPERTRAHGA